jgi:hypothetical protein
MAADKPEKSSKEKKAKLTKEKKKPKTTKSASVPLAHPSYLLVCTNFSLPSFCFLKPWVLSAYASSFSSSTLIDATQPLKLALDLRSRTDMQWWDWLVSNMHAVLGAVFFWWGVSVFLSLDGEGCYWDFEGANRIEPVCDCQVS